MWNRTTQYKKRNITFPWQNYSTQEAIKFTIVRKEIVRQQFPVPKKIITIKENTSILIVVIACIYETYYREHDEDEDIQNQPNPQRQTVVGRFWFYSNITFSTWLFFSKTLFWFGFWYTKKKFVDPEIKREFITIILSLLSPEISILFC